MKIPNRIQPLIDDGLVDDVLQRLKSGKEADVYTVLCGDKIQCAKVYKEASLGRPRETPDSRCILK